MQFFVILVGYLSAVSVHFIPTSIDSTVQYPAAVAMTDLVATTGPDRPVRMWTLSIESLSRLFFPRPVVGGNACAM